jgi:hypothetical protein
VTAGRKKLDSADAGASVLSLTFLAGGAARACSGDLAAPERLREGESSRLGCEGWKVGAHTRN